MQIQRKRRRRLGPHIKPNLTKRRLQSELPIDLSLIEKELLPELLIEPSEIKKGLQFEQPTLPNVPKGRPCLRHTTMLIAVLG